MNSPLSDPSAPEARSFSRAAAPLLAAAALVLLALPGASEAQTLPKLTVGFDQAQGPKDVAVTLELIAMLTVLSLAPSILIMMTCFTRVVVVLTFLKQALGTQNAPPNQMLMGLSLFLTFFIMSPTFKKINDEALQPYLAEKVDIRTGIDKAMGPLREFMLRQVNEKDLALMVRISDSPAPRNVDDIANLTLIPAFCISELRSAFIIGFLIYIPFLVIDMVVSSVLMSMGMMMLPPVMISTPFKLILFVLVDGWNLIIHQLVLSFR
ncbi:MAG TPA: flagellar type III secretion system pore protein FliP [Fibrobacteria bacterium]|nr:flagellar type III secretion system pore protein FliP [Fibrobacteria bacterium]